MWKSHPSAGTALDPKPGLLATAPSPTVCVASPEGAPLSWTAFIPLSNERAGPGDDADSPVSVRSLRQEAALAMATGQRQDNCPQRARPPPLSHRALSEERPEGLLSHRGLWQTLSSLPLMVSCSSSSPSRTAAARASQKYTVAS